jgi:hypothetical protein
MNGDQPERDSAHEPSAADYGIRIEGNALVLPSGCTLPLKCVLTNQPVTQSEMIFTNLTWTPKSVGLSAISGAPSLVFAHFVGRELCTITYGLNWRARVRRVLWTLVNLVLCVALFAATLAMAISSSTHWSTTALLYGFFALFLLSVAALFLRRKPLNVVDYRDGMFWITGFSQEYLDALEF